MGCSYVKHRTALLIQILVVLDLVRCTETERTGHTLREHTRSIGFHNSKTMITSDLLAFPHQLFRQSLATEFGVDG
uniref:Putative secreted protein n=1 Tax=Anopheles darlingi TaxID=43151 RepID=A0A2M4D4Q8_ANODA